MGMNRNKTGSKAGILGLTAMMVIFALLLFRLFALRFETGDVLPPYSSLRSDPLGARALYESLNDLPRVTARRHFRSQAKLVDPLETGERATVLILGLRYFSLRFTNKEEIQIFDRVAADGGRLVIACFPAQKPALHIDLTDEEETEKDGDADKKDGLKKVDKDAGKEPADLRDALKDPKDKSAPSKEKKKDPGSLLEAKKDSLENHWGFKIEIAGKDESMETARAAREAPLDWPKSLTWHSKLYFDDLDDAWRVLYTARENPVIVERPIGRGSVVLMADSYLFSNEALLKERRPALLAGLVSPGGQKELTVIFDESHFGVRESDNVAVLVRKYHLHWPLAALILLAGLYIWKNAVSLVPPPDSGEEQREAVHASGRDSFSGLVSLMRRSVTPGELLSVCYKEWRSIYTLEEGRRNLLEQVEKEIAAPSRDGSKKWDQVDKYRTICGILSEGRPWKKARKS